MDILKRSIGSCLLKLTGWTFDRDFVWEEKQVVVGFPHTSNMDGVRTLFMFPQLGIDAHFLIKKELFRWPFSAMLTYMGGVPVTRGKNKNQVELIAEEFKKRDEFTLALSPEGTRTKGKDEVPPIKTGFWHIARLAGVPIVLMFSDNKNKRGRFLGSLRTGDDIHQDMARIQEIYRREGIEIKVPEPADKQPG